MMISSINYRQNSERTMVCRICRSKNIELLKYISGYDGEYRIFRCFNCDAHFSSDPHSNPYQNYKEFYPAYLAQAKQIKKEPGPFRFLLDSDCCYLPVKEAIKDRAKLNILDVGCGYGYLTYALRKLGHNVKGIDTTKEAIEFARENFGDTYHLTSIEDYDGEFNIIIALGTIEHVRDVFSFLVSCKKLLKPDGKIILTTPNKDFFSIGIWRTEKPPVHLSWLSRKTFEVLAKKLNMNVNFIDFRPFISKNERDNNLVTYFIKSLPETFDTQSMHKKLLRALTVRNFYWLLPMGCFILFLRNFDFRPIRYVSNLFYRKFLWRGFLTLGINLTSK